MALSSYSIRCVNVVVHSVFFLDGLLSDILSKSSTGCLYRSSESYCTGEDGICIRLYRVIKESLSTWRLQYNHQVHRDFLITLYFPERLITQILIFIYIPKIQKWLQILDIKRVVNESMKGPCKHRTGHKRKHTYLLTYSMEQSPSWEANQ